MQELQAGQIFSLNCTINDLDGIIEQAQQGGVVLSLSLEGKLVATGAANAVAVWRDRLRDLRPAIVTRLMAKVAPFESVAAQIQRVLGELALLSDDRRFIEQRLRELGLPANGRESLLLEYQIRWESAAAVELVEVKRDNSGRYAANLWLVTQ